MPILNVFRIHGKQLAKVNAHRTDNPNFTETQFLGSVKTIPQERIPYEKWQAHIKREVKRRKSLTTMEVKHIFA